MTGIQEALLTAWLPHKENNTPAPTPVRLWGRGGCGVWLSDSWGPPIPYPPADREDGNKNYGYRATKGDFETIRQIPEVQGWPEFALFLERINAFESPIESVGCEKAYSALEGENAVNQLSTFLGAYIDVNFSNVNLNGKPENFLIFAAKLIPSVLDCEKWWGDISFVLQRSKFIHGVSSPWGMMLNIKNAGRSEDEARHFWGRSLERLGTAIANLPYDFHAYE